MRARHWPAMLVALLMPVGLLAIPSAQADPGDPGIFSTNCTYSHANNDDPILYPQIKGAAHRHQFTGNTTTNFRTTTKRLKAGSTTCDRSEDLSAQWTPALYEDGVELAPTEAHVYYRNGNVHNNLKNSIVPFPRGFRMIAGTSNHPEAPPGQRTAEWACARDNMFSQGTPGIPATCDGAWLVALITFPSCWDGVNLTTPDQSHVIYPWQNEAHPRWCPPSHPVVLPELTQQVRYNPAADDQTNLTLSSGPSESVHADFWNAWEADKLAELVRVCLVGGIECGTIGAEDPPASAASAIALRPVNAWPTGEATRSGRTASVRCRRRPRGARR